MSTLNYEGTQLDIKAPEERGVDVSIKRGAGFVVNETASQEKSPEEKEYILLFFFSDDCREFEDVIGRTEAYRKAKAYTEEGADVYASTVLVEGVPIEKRVNLYTFLKKMEAIFVDDNFNVEDYVVADDPETVGFAGDPKPQGDQQFSSTDVFHESMEEDV